MQPQGSGWLKVRTQWRADDLRGNKPQLFLSLSLHPVCIDERGHEHMMSAKGGGGGYPKSRCSEGGCVNSVL